MQFTDVFGKKIKKLDQNVIYILCHPYSADPLKNFKKCVNIVHKLRSEYNITIFSPILHTHQYDLMINDLGLDNKEDYYQWDLKIYECFKKNAVILFPSNYTSSKGCILEHTWAKSNNRKILYFDE